MDRGEGIAVKRTLPWNGGTRFILEQCLFDSSHHGTSAALIELDNGAKVYRCLHNGCVDRKWADVREKFEPGYRERSRSNPGSNNSEQDQPDGDPPGAEAIKTPAADPISLDDPLLPDLPPGIFPESSERFIDAVAVSTETPRGLAAMMEIGTIAAAVQRKYEVEVEPGYSEPLSLWVLPILPSGHRKTAVVNAVTDPLLRWEAEQIATMKPAIAKSRSDREIELARITEKRKKASRAEGDALAKLKEELV
jgi:uncharacterized protein DUF3987